MGGGNRNGPRKPWVSPRGDLKPANVPEKSPKMGLGHKADLVDAS